MCDGERLLLNMKQLQVKPEPLCCTVDSDCWCMRVQTRFSHPLDKEDCMSPQEMLDMASVDLPEHDRIYLNGLVGREFKRCEHDKT